MVLLEFQSRVQSLDGGALAELRQFVVGATAARGPHFAIGKRAAGIALVPLVLYNDARRWAAPRSVAVLIDLPPTSPLWARQPALTPLVIDIGAYEAADLQRRPSLAARLSNWSSFGTWSG